MGNAPLTIIDLTTKKGAIVAPRRQPSTLRDVARLAGVSPATVSNVMQNHPRVADATRKRVQDAARALQYEPNPLARSLRSGRTGTIALITPGLQNAYFAELATELIRTANAYNRRISVEVLDGDRQREESILTGTWTSFADGILYIPQKLTGREIDYVLDSRAGRRPPVVLLGERGAGADCAQVTYRNSDASQAAVKLLLDGGAKRVVAIGPHERAGSATPRLEGYTAALKQAGIPLRPELIRETPTWHRSAGMEAVSELLAEGVEFDAVFAFNDMIALGAMAALANAGLRVPDDVQVVGFDDVEESNFSVPALSTIDPGKAEAAQLALELLDAILAGTEPTNRQIFPDFSVVARGTTLASPNRSHAHD
ncbi:transcriptional regulator, LacI family [Ruaniaceae bacterium KH17]|nr:transcriptional regulator, LacI family [Ruaniaceae bacterium KH17]